MQCWQLYESALGDNKPLNLGCQIVLDVVTAETQTQTGVALNNLVGY